MKNYKDVFLFYSVAQIQHISKRIIGDNLSPKEMRYLKARMIAEMHNLIIKINSSGIGK